MAFKWKHTNIKGLRLKTEFFDGIENMWNVLSSTSWTHQDREVVQKQVIRKFWNLFTTPVQKIWNITDNLKRLHPGAGGSSIHMLSF